MEKRLSLAIVAIAIITLCVGCYGPPKAQIAVPEKKTFQKTTLDLTPINASPDSICDLIDWRPVEAANDTVGIFSVATSASMIPNLFDSGYLDNLDLAMKFSPEGNATSFRCVLTLSSNSDPAHEYGFVLVEGEAIADSQDLIAVANIYENSLDEGYKQKIEIDEAWNAYSGYAASNGAPWLLVYADNYIFKISASRVMVGTDGNITQWSAKNPKGSVMLESFTILANNLLSKLPKGT